ncbi:MAG: ABC transporter substrate-binding protein [Myxococcales bacterium]
MKSVWIKKALSVLLAGGIVFPLAHSGCSHSSEEQGTSLERLSPDNPIEKWGEVFQPSVLTREQRLAELEWFRKAAEPLRGIKIISTAENIETHYWESRVLARAFRDITGIEVDHRIIGEGDLVDQIKDQIENGVVHAHIYVNDSDTIGWHLRTQAVVTLSDYLKGEGAPYTNPGLDLPDFINLEFGQDFDGNLLQLPDQQFVNLYWFRYDWFTREDIKAQFKAKYGYELGVPVNWSAYEDIAEFFTNTPVDGKKVYGHLDYGKPSPSLGWRFTDAWLSIAGVGDKGLPNGIPVDEWGIRVEGTIPVGSSVTRGGDLNGPAAVYALEKYLEGMKKYAPPEALQWEWVDSGPQAARGDIAQQIFQYVTWLSDPRFHSADSPVCDKYGKPKWRVAPTPHGDYWEKGMKVGYQDQGSWTIPKTTKGKELAAAWLWAQFAGSKTVDLKKFIVGGTPVRRSTIFSEYLTQNIESYGGIVDFYRSPVENQWTGSGRNVPYYPGMCTLWWQNVAKAITGELTPQQAMDKLASEQDAMMASPQVAALLHAHVPRLNPERPREYWYDQPGAPKPPQPRMKPETIDYETLIKQWTRR